MPMPWWIAVLFSCYAVVLIWQGTNQLDVGIKGLTAVPFLLAKLAVMLVALAYWEPRLCHMAATKLGWQGFVVALTLAIMEAAKTLRAVSAEANQPQRTHTFLMAFALITTMLLPAIILVLAGRVLLMHQCVEA